MRRFESFSHISEPRPMPIENVPSSTVTTSGSADSTFFAKLKNDDRKVAPTNHSQEMPSRLRNTVRFSRASFRLRHVSLTGFQLMRRSGCGAAVTGTKLDTTRPTSAIATHAPASTTAPCSARPAPAPPTIVPIRIATKVPISTMPLPPTSSAFDRCCGKYEYLTGPNTVEWTPIRNVHRYSNGALCSQKPAPPISITTISKLLTKRVSMALSYLSAIWPEVAENSTNGRMKMAEIRNAAVFGSTPEKRAA